MVTLEVGLDARGVVQGTREGMQALVQMTNSAQHLVTVMETLGGTAGVLGKFGAVVARWQPLLLVATTALSAINLAMSAWSRTTDQATDSLKRQGSALNELIAKTNEVNMRAGYGVENPRRSVPGTIDTLVALRQGRWDIGLGIDKAAGLFGATEMEMRGALMSSGYDEAMAKIWNKRDQRWEWDWNPTLHPGQMISAGERLLAERRTSSRVGYGPDGKLLGPMGSTGIPYTEAYYGRSDMVSMTEHERNRVEQANREQGQQQQEALERMREMARLAGQIGGALGDAATDLIFGMRTAREIGAALIQDFARQALRSAFSSVTQSMFTGMGLTGPQAR